jgi:endonuclease YncB( thermonuclease family)
MQIVRTSLLACVAIAQLLRPTRSDPLLVTSVIDGNTIEVQSIGRVRLLGIRAPALGRTLDGNTPGSQARDRLASLVLRRWIRLEHEDGPDHFVSTRRPAYVWTEDERLVNVLLVREGLARVVTRTNLTRRAELERAEEQAKAQRRGVWAGSIR